MKELFSKILVISLLFSWSAYANSYEDNIKKQIASCWSMPMGLPATEEWIVKIKLKLNPDGSVSSSELLSKNSNKKKEIWFKSLSKSLLTAVKICSPYKITNMSYDEVANLELDFDAIKVLKGQ